MAEKNNVKVRPNENQEIPKQSGKEAYEAVKHALEEIGGYWIGLRESGMPGKQRISITIPLAFSELTKTQVEIVKEMEESVRSGGGFNFEIPQKVESVLGTDYGLFTWRTGVVPETIYPAVLSAMRKIIAKVLEGMDIGKNVDKDLLTKDICGTLEESAKEVKR